MRILAVGGGSGGHVTPVAAVINSLREEAPRADIRVWCDQTFAAQTKETLGALDGELRIDVISSGKFRRYHHLSIARQLVMIREIVLPNLIDGFKIVFGFFQSVIKLIIWRPHVVFCKGGFVCLPVGVAAHLLRIPIVLHDSDAHPGLTNRILSRWATRIATGATLDNYSYPLERSSYVGIPISDAFRPFSVKERAAFKESIGFSGARPLTVVTGGGLGARPINQAVIGCIDSLVKFTDVVLIAGTTNYKEVLAQLEHVPKGHLQVHAFIGSDMAKYLGAADIAVARAGATTLLELAALGTPTIVVPNPNLTGGHQLKNANAYEDKKAIVVLDEASITKNSEILSAEIKRVLGDKKLEQSLSEHISHLAMPRAANDVAEIILAAARKNQRHKQ